MLAALSSLQEALGENLCPGSFRLLAKFSSIRQLDLGPCFLAGCQLGTALGSQGCSLVLALLPLLLLSRCSRVRPCVTHRWQPTRLPRPWDSPGKNTCTRAPISQSQPEHMESSSWCHIPLTSARKCSLLLKAHVIILSPSDNPG